MTKCIKCGVSISDEESKARYEELCKMGIIPQMVTICKSCREKPEEKVSTWKEWAQDTGRYQNGYRVFRDGSYREDFGSDR